MINKLPSYISIASIIFILAAEKVFAHEGEEEEIETALVPTLEDTIRANSIKVVIIGSILILLVVILTVLFKDKGEGVKKLIFAGIAAPVLAVTIFLVSATVYLNTTSSSGGPVHWHADFEIWDCGQKLELVDPQGISNRVGSATFHEHNDDRIHVEGVVVNKDEASLERFFRFIGGRLHMDGFEIPTNEGLIVKNNNDLCSDKKPGKLQVFVYKIVNATTNQNSNFVYKQEKLTDFTDYILSPYGNVPPGDCVIVEFSQEKEKTDKLCGSYKLQQMKGKLYGD
ncbi:MAG: hypothetical protein A2134_01090 [Candidatus Woykebacteria bacterium RBG_16_39_9b]|uniref:Uncharacterized protein n=1 Tax=Candidatus Woykebacteria bacterium RBG_16_39_9b TaxID=1802595 RepID=A0A1G1WBH6_9BACT|nr:MAG: hypothetical protein A2134_01090 [Candidatus Woykebacteria bacterium RBG_16_39_9b]